MHVRVEVTIGRHTFTNQELGSVEVRQELGHHTTCSLLLSRDSGQLLNLQDVLGELVDVRLTDEDGDSVVIFTGELREGAQSFHQAASGERDAADVASSLSLEATSFSAWLDHAQCAYYAKATLTSMAKKFNVRLVDAPADGPKLDLIQIGETEFQFLVRLADENGCFVRTEGAQVVVQRGFSEPAVELRWSDDLHALSAVCRPQNHGFEGSMYEEAEKAETTIRGIRQDPVWLTGADALTNHLKKLASKLEGGGDPNVEDIPFRLRDVRALRDTLLQESERQLGASIVVSGSSHNVAVVAGQKVHVENGDGFKAPFTGEFGVTRVVHRFDGRVYGNDFMATPWKNYSSPSRPPRRLVPGPLTAEVLDNEDPEGRGRVKVRFRWQSGDIQSRWLRVATLYSGRDRGLLFMPEVNDEVLVAFEHGDPERGVVIGALWNGKDPAPFEKGNNAKRIVTRTGSTVQLLDTAGEERIEIYTPEGRCWVQLSNAGGKPCITLHSEGDLVLEAKGEMRFTSESFVHEVKKDSQRAVGGNESTEVKGDHLLKAGKRLAAEGTNVTLKAGALLESVAGGNQMIAGALVHIQPPGHQARPIKIKPPKARPSPWAKTKTPASTQPAKKHDAAATPRKKLAPKKEA